MTKLLLALPLIMLGACNSEPQVKMENASVGEVAKEIRKQGGDDSFVGPGKWQSTVTIDEMNIPGLPPEFAAKMKEHMAKVRQVESCLTPAEAKRPKGDFFAADKSCTYDHFEMGGGKIDATMRCSHEGMAQSMTMKGSYTPNEYHMAMSTRMEGTGRQSGTTMTMHIDAKRVGACDGTEAADVAN